MPGPELFLVRIGFGRLGGRSLDASAQEALKVLGLPAGDILAMDLCLILGKELKLGLRDRVTFQVDLEAMRRLQGTFRGRINGPLDITVFGFVNCRQQVEVALSVSFFPTQVVRADVR